MQKSKNIGRYSFTHDGLSGPGILDLSRYIRAEDVIKLSFVPEDRREALEEWLVERARRNGGRSLRSVLAVCLTLCLLVCHSHPVWQRDCWRSRGLPQTCKRLNWPERCEIDWLIIWQVYLWSYPMFVALTWPCAPEAEWKPLRSIPKPCSLDWSKDYIWWAMFWMWTGYGGYNLQAAFLRECWLLEASRAILTELAAKKVFQVA